MSSIDRRDFLDGPKAVEHCGAKHLPWVMEKGLGTTTHHIHDILDQYLFHYIHRVIRRVTVVSKPIHQIPH